jgi:putative endonuclease
VIHTYWVYILASRSRVLYTGVTNDLARRVKEHKQSLIPGFTKQYRVTRLVHFEQFGDIRDAIAREKQIKGWVRARKIELIEARNRIGLSTVLHHCDLSPFFVARRLSLSS